MERMSVNNKNQKPTWEQINKYIEAADSDLGPECTESWVAWCRQTLMNVWVEEMELYSKNLPFPPAMRGGSSGTGKPYGIGGSSTVVPLETRDYGIPDPGDSCLQCGQQRRYYSPGGACPDTGMTAGTSQYDSQGFHKYNRFVWH